MIYTDSVGAPIIRGQDTQGPNNRQNQFWGGTVPRATINLDGHYLNYNEMFFGATSVWDVDSIEVFRGPQTTSQGANAIAGAIIVNTKDPTFTPRPPTRPRSATTTPSAPPSRCPGR
ncbi:TonB-dependent receptor plug domain-containing protein [Pseudomonas qingdaonensis]|nr:TonB-dependent receptor plug domain-containing protein [Pseudomonas qingdaonensis]